MTSIACEKTRHVTNYTKLTELEMPTRLATLKHL